MLKNIALDIPGGKLYYTVSSDPNYTINRVNFDGTNNEIIVADDLTSSPTCTCIRFNNNILYFLIQQMIEYENVILMVLV